MKLSLVSFLQPQWIFQFVWHNYCWSKLSVKTTNTEVWLSWNRLTPFHHHISGDLAVYIVGKIRKAILLLLCPSLFPLSTPWNKNFNLLVESNLWIYFYIDLITTIVTGWIPAQARHTRCNIMWESLSVTCDRSVVISPGTPVSSTMTTAI